MHRRIRLAAVIVSVLAATLALAACGGSGKSNSTTSANATGGGIPKALNTYNSNPSGAKQTGGTVYWAEAANGAPNYIFPMFGPQECGVNNFEYLSGLLYRPLYWAGNDNKAVIDYNYSVGNQPTWSNGDKTVTIQLKHWKWSDGEPVTSQDVALYISLYKGDPAENFCGYVPPAATGEKFFPDNVVSYGTPNSSTIVLHLSQAYNPTWFLYNELTQITPIPMAWDTTSLAGVGKRDNASGILSKSAGESVYNFLNAQSKDTTSWATSPIWSIVDGPWKLSAFSATGEATFIPNSKYSGSPKPTISKFVEVPFTSNNAELTALKTGGPSALTVGFLPPEDASQLSSLKADGYQPQAAYVSGFNFFPLNQNNPTLGPTFKQTYFRQAFQHLVDQQGWITAFLNGWAEPTSGPVPVNPPNPFADALAKTNVYQFSVQKAKQLLSSHGWTVKPGGVTTCTKPGSGSNECGAGVKAGTRLSFNLDYVSGEPVLEDEMQQLASAASRVGIQINLTSRDFSTVLADAPPCKSSQSSCTWTAANWGGGWVYAPDFYPSGETIFMPGAGGNTPNYSNATASKLILKTTTASASQSQAALDAYQNYIIHQVPGVFAPTALGNPYPGSPALISKRLGGVVPNSFGYITPEAWYLTR